MDVPVAPGVHGIDTTMSAVDYHALPRLSSTKLKAMSRSYAEYMSLHTAPVVATSAMELGTAVHTLVLEPDLADTHVVRVPVKTRASKAFKAAMAEAPEGALVMTASEYQRAIQCERAVWVNPKAARVLEEGTAETNLFWDDGGVECKARIDWMTPNGWLVDLKTTGTKLIKFTDWMWRDFAIQAAWYSRGARSLGLQVQGFLHIVVETQPPHICEVYQISPSDLERADEVCSETLDTYRSHLTDPLQWRGYSATDANGEPTIQLVKLKEYVWR